MTHHIIALIGPSSLIEEASEHVRGPAPTALPFGLSILPLGGDQIDQLADYRDPWNPLPTYDGFMYLGPELEAGIARAAPQGRLLYVETNYFGGIGYQGATLFDAGRPVWKAILTNVHDAWPRPPNYDSWAAGRPKLEFRTPISRGLSRLGVPEPTSGDEFDAVGLGRFRTLEALGVEEDDDE